MKIKVSAPTEGKAWQMHVAPWTLVQELKDQIY